jgi:hypothetical protein
MIFIVPRDLASLKMTCSFLKISERMQYKRFFYVPGFIRRHSLLSYEWLEMKSFTWEDRRRQTTLTLIESASMKRVFAL